jgi:hypothetical protein
MFWSCDISGNRSNFRSRQVARCRVESGESSFVEIVFRFHVCWEASTGRRGLVDLAFEAVDSGRDRRDLCLIGAFTDGVVLAGGFELIQLRFQRLEPLFDLCRFVLDQRRS